MASTLTLTLTPSQWSTIGSRCLRRYHRELVEGVDPQSIVDYLFQEELLSVEDLEMVQNLPTRSGRMRHLLAALHGRLVASEPEVVLRHFLSSLNRDYFFLETKLRENLDRLIEEEIAFNRRTIAKSEVNRRSEVNHDHVTERCNASEERHLESLNDEPIEKNGKEKQNLKFPMMESGEQDPMCLKVKNGLKDFSGAVAIPRSKTSPPSEYVGKRAVVLSPSGECSDQLKYGNFIGEITGIVSPPGELFANVNLRSNRQRSLGVLAPDLDLDLGPLSMPPSNRGKRFKSDFHRKIFDVMSNSVNDQHFDHFSRVKTELSDRARRDPDTSYLILYLDACKCAIKSDFVTSKRIVEESLRLASAASSPNSFCALSLSVRVWINLKKRKLNKADRALTQALDLVSQDPVTCSGMTAGWLYVDEAKLLMARMTSTMRHADVIRRRAVGAMERALEQFRKDGSADGPYGVNFASVKLASLLLACDDRLALVDLVEPTPDDVTRADLLLTSVDDSPVGIPVILKPLFLIARADRKFRSGSLKRAVELACEAKDVSSRTKLEEEEALAEVRLSCYSHRLMRQGRGAVVASLVASSWSSDEADVEGSDVDDDDDDVITGSGRKTRRKTRKTRNATGSFRDCSFSSSSSSSSQELGKRTLSGSVLGFSRSVINLLRFVVVCLIISGFVFNEAFSDNGQPQSLIEIFVNDKIDGRL